MRLALINQFYLPDLSPTAHLAASVAQHRAARGDRVTVLAGTGSYIGTRIGGPSRRGENPRVLHLWTPSLGKDSLGRRLLDYGVFYLQAAVLAITLPRQDVMILMTTPPYIALAGLLHKLLHPNTRLVLWNMDCYPETAERAGLMPRGSLLSRILRWVNRLIYRRLDSVVCLDRAMRDLVSPAYTRGGRPPVHVLSNWEPYGLFPREFKPAGGRPAGTLDRRARLVVTYLGNAGAGHRFETILDAAARLAAESIAFLFVGGGSAWHPLQTEVQQRGLSNVVLLGYVPKDETPGVLAGSDVALITLRDSMLGVMSPSKLHASLAMGLPILYLGPPGGNVDDAIRQYGCGVSLRHGDTEGVVAFLQRLGGDPSFLGSLRSNARHAFEAEYNDQVALPKFDAWIDSPEGSPSRIE